MKPSRSWSCLLALLWCTGMAGCTTPGVRSQSPETEAEAIGAKIRVVGDMTAPYNTHPVRVEAVALVTQLDGTGSDPEPSPQRAALIDEMQFLGVAYPQQVLASPNTSLVLVQGYMRPGIRKGDHFDLEVRTPARSETFSLRGGWLMEARLTEMAVLGAQVRTGRPLGLGGGAVLVDPSAAEDDDVALCRGRILGGGVALHDRPLGLVLKPKYQNVLNSQQIGLAINRRFHTYHNGVKEGVATPKNDEYIELDVHPRYKDNIERYIEVIRAIPVRETAAERVSRIQLLERQLLDPLTSSMAALRLEALGKDGIPSLTVGLQAGNAEVRFYSAEALAYLDVPDAAEALAESARTEAAFRAFALAALSSLNDYRAYEALRSLIDADSVETRYGAFRALWAMNSEDPFVQGESLNDKFHLHVLPTVGEPFVHATRTYRPEIVLFGSDQRLLTPCVLEAGHRIMINGRSAEEVTVSRFAAGEPEQQRVVSPRLEEIIRAIVELGGNYPDVVQALQQAKSRGALSGRFEIDAIPMVGRRYTREADDAEPASSDGETPATVEEETGPTGPAPDLFGGASQPLAGRGGSSSSGGRSARPKPESSRPWWNPFAKLGD